MRRLHFSELGEELTAHLRSDRGVSAGLRDLGEDGHRPGLLRLVGLLLEGDHLHEWVRLLLARALLLHRRRREVEIGDLLRDVLGLQLGVLEGRQHL